MKPKNYTPLSDEVEALCAKFGFYDKEQVAAIRILPGQIEFDVALLTKNGEKYIDPASDRMARETHTFPVLT